MNKKQSNKLNAYHSVKGVLDKHRRICNAVPMLAQTVIEFRELLDQIQEVGARTIADTTGETSAKLLAKEKLARLAHSLAAAGMAYAFDQSDTEMESALDYSYYRIRHAKDAKTLEIAGAIATELGSKSEELSDYMVTAEDLAELQDHIAGFNKALVIKGGTKSAMVADNKLLARLFGQTDKLLYRKLDRLMFRMKPDHPDFFVAYRSARTIIDH
jgi:hypothetical protein